jgi:NDP-sugar pyrophosphorylase family protein
MAQRPVGIILTAGFGTRLKELSLLRPKPIMEIAGRPIIYFLLRMLEKAGINDIFLNLHYYPQQIRQVIDDNKFKARIHYAYEKAILGTAGGLRNIVQHFALKNRQVVVLHGDIICDFDLKPLITTNEFCTLVCAKNHVVPGYVGSVGVNQHDDVVQLGRFFRSESEPFERGFFTGIHVLSRSAVQKVLASSESSLVADIYPRWLKSGQVIKGLVEHLDYDDLGTPERLFQANMAILRGHRFRHVDVFDGFTSVSDRPGIICCPSATVANTAEIVPPVMINAHAEIGDYAQIGPHAIIGENVRVLAGARVTNSIVLSKTTIEKDEIVNCMIALRSARVVVKEK